jgi:hypothetical protein
MRRRVRMLSEQKDGNVIEGEPVVDFPYFLSDLRYWIIKRKDGIISKTTVIMKGESGAESVYPLIEPKALPPFTGTDKPVEKRFCNHTPSTLPIFTGQNGKGKEIRLFIADATGTRKEKGSFDLILDCGKIFSDYELRAVPSCGNILSGNSKLEEELQKFNIQSPPIATMNTLKIEWEDRAAPTLDPAFWPALAERIEGNILCSCQGGHGRSGTSLVCLMLVMNPEYSAADAIIHLRALHCIRSIESFAQHKYIDSVATYLGRTPDADRIKSMNSFHDAFMKFPHPSAKEYQVRIK